VEASAGIEEVAYSPENIEMNALSVNNAWGVFFLRVRHIAQNDGYIPSNET
jgi:hypothetical protein